jgi:hypothetical protein
MRGASRRLSSWTCVAAIAVLGAMTPTSAGVVPIGEPQKVALVIGSNSFLRLDNERRRYAEADVHGIGTVLAGNGYRVAEITGAEATHRNLVKALYALARTLEPSDDLVLYCNLPIAQDAGRLYVLGHDASFDALDADALRLDHLLDLVADIRARHKLVILDITLLAGDSSRVTRLGALDSELNRPLLPSANERLGNGLFTRNLLAENRDSVVLSFVTTRAVESDVMRGGVVAVAVEEGFKEGKADTNGDGFVTVGEIREYVAMRAALLTGDPASFVSLYSGAADVLEWKIGSVRSQDSTLLQVYTQRLRAFAANGSIGLETYLDALELLDRWDGGRGQVTLADTEKLEVLLKHLAATGVSEQVIGSSLDTSMRAARSMTR